MVVRSIPDRSAQLKPARPADDRAEAVGVYVLGMHRSGTSVTTRLVNLLGVPLCDAADLLGKVRGNPKGLWESGTLVKFNNALLHELNSEWWCPPRPNDAWVEHPAIAANMDAARSVFTSVHPTRQWVWKDPRNCITLPFWLRSLETKPVAILPVRDPLEIAASLKTRDKFDPSVSLALWERYLQHLLPSLRHLPVLVTRFEDVVRNPARWCETTRQFLASQRVMVDAQWDAQVVHEFVEPSLRHHVHAAALPERSLSASQQALYEKLMDLVGIHPKFEPPLTPIEDSITDKTFEGFQRAYPRAAGRLSDFDGFAVRETRARNVRARPPRPPVSVVIASRNEGPALKRTVDQLVRTLPASAQIIVVDDASVDRSAQRLRGIDRVKIIRSKTRVGIVGARMLGAEEAKGEILIFSDAHVLPRAGWFSGLGRELSRPEVGAVGPVLTPLRRRDLRVGGLAIFDDALNVEWLTDGGKKPYPVPLLPGCFFGIRSDTFHRLGGFDRGMIGYGAEDLELCIRLWRRGLECRVVPGSEVGHRFQAGWKRGVDWDLFLFNLLRLGVLHLGNANLERFLGVLRNHTGFGDAMARIIAGDSFQRRAEIRQVSRFDDQWFFDRFDTKIFTDGTGHDHGDKAEESARIGSQIGR